MTTTNTTSHPYPSHPYRTQNGKNAEAGDKDHDWFWLQAGRNNPRTHSLRFPHQAPFTTRTTISHPNPCLRFMLTFILICLALSALPATGGPGMSFIFNFPPALVIRANPTPNRKFSAAAIPICYCLCYHAADSSTTLASLTPPFLVLFVPVCC